MNHEPPHSVTVGIPVYNAEQTIAATLQRVAAQDYEDLRILISDNASTDATTAICRDVVGHDARFRLLVHDDNRGWQANFRYVIERARTPLFMWLGADDHVAPSYVSANAALLAGRPDLVGSVSRVRWTHGGQPGDEAPGTQPLEGSPAENVHRYLRVARDNSRFYGLFRTDELRRSIPPDDFFGLDLAIMAGTLRFGGHGRVDDILMWRERNDPSTYVTHIDRDATGFAERLLPFRGLTRALRAMDVPLSGGARRWLWTRNLYEHVRYWSNSSTAYGRAGRVALPLAERLRSRLVATGES